MSSDDDSVGEWARVKLECLEKYLNAYTTILRTRPWKTIYVDAFAGRGQYRLRGQASSEEMPLFEEEDPAVMNDKGREIYINGSPKVALSLKYPFDAYRFIDKDPERVKLLRHLKTEFEGRDISVIDDDCRSYLEQRLIPRFDIRKHRAVVFLDPFGMQVPWETLAALGRTRGVEVILNFPVGMAIQRLLRRDGNFSPDRRRRLDEYFGTTTWFERLYRQAGPDLWGEMSFQKVPLSADILVDWYRGRLRKAFDYVSEARLVKNSRGGHLYYLIFAGPKPTGAKIFDDIILRQGEKVGAA